MNIVLYLYCRWYSV